MADGSSRRLERTLERVAESVSPGDIRMLRELAKESRLAALAAFPAPERVVHQQRDRVRIRAPFVHDTVRHLALLDDLARLVVDRLEAPIGRRPPLPCRLGDVERHWASRAVSGVRPSDIVMLRRLGREARLLAQRALPQPSVRAELRRPYWARLAFLEDAIRHLLLLDELARLVEGKLWDI